MSSADDDLRARVDQFIASGANARSVAIPSIPRRDHGWWDVGDHAQHLGERVLGLPEYVRVDKGFPWSAIPK
jgi:hypothetical protein